MHSCKKLYFKAMIFEIATFKIKIQRRRSALLIFPESFYKNYGRFISKKQGPSDFSISIVPYGSFSLSSIKFARRRGHFYHEKNSVFIIKTLSAIVCINTLENKMALGFKNTNREKKNNTICMSLVRLAVSLCAIRKGGLPFHSSAMAFGNRGIAFSGRSGAGKTTIAKLLVMPGQLLNDDFNVILPGRKGAYKIYSTPFAHPETLKSCVNRGAELRRIFFIEKSQTNKIENLSFRNKYILTLGQTLILPLSDFVGKKILNNAERLCGNVECKRLYFNNDGSIRPFMYRYVGDMV
jgi:hypothetical protein